MAKNNSGSARSYANPDKIQAGLTVPEIRSRKRTNSDSLVMVTAYDTPSAKVVDAAGADVILVGDSLGMVVLGHEDTLSVTVQEMAHHTAAVARARPSSLIVADMPWLSYHLCVEDTVKNAAQLIRAGAKAVKLEGGQPRLPMIEALISAEIPVMGHLGLTPQSLNALGGFKVQAKTLQAAQMLADNAKALQYVGCFAIVLEGIPAEVAKIVTERLDVPTIGIGAGPDCDGQVLVYHDLLSYGSELSPKFVRTYANIDKTATEAISTFVADVKSGSFPQAQESYSLPPEESQLLSQI